MVKKKFKLKLKLVKGTLGGKGFFSKTSLQRRKIEVKLAKKIGEKSVVGKLRAIQVLTKNTSPVTSKKALADSKFIAGSFQDKKKVKFPRGFR